MKEIFLYQHHFWNFEIWIILNFWQNKIRKKINQAFLSRKFWQKYQQIEEKFLCRNGNFGQMILNIFLPKENFKNCEIQKNVVDIEIFLSYWSVLIFCFAFKFNFYFKDLKAKIKSYNDYLRREQKTYIKEII